MLYKYGCKKELDLIYKKTGVIEIKWRKRMGIEPTHRALHPVHRI